MRTKKSLVFSFCLFVILVWIWGFGTPALSETLKCKHEMKMNLEEMGRVDYDYFVGVNTRSGSATCENGETATVKSYVVWDANETKECNSQGYIIYTFSDFSNMVMKFKLFQVPDPKGEAKWVWDGTGEIIKGTKRFVGIKGNVSIKGKQLPSDRKAISELTISYALSPK